MSTARRQFVGDPAIEARARQLHASGMGRNEIARELGCGAATMTKLARKLNLTFDKKMTEAATRARVADAKAARADLVLRLYHQAHAALDVLDQPTHDLVEVSAGKAVKYTATRLPAQDVKALVQASTHAAEKAHRLELADADHMNLPAVDAWLDAMTDGTQSAPPDTTGG